MQVTRALRLVAVFAVTAILSAVAFSATSALADGNCGGGEGCSWKQINYEGARRLYQWKNYYQFMGDYNRSAKNRFGNRRMRIFAQNGDLLSCINAGGNDSNLYLRSFFVKTGALGNNC